ncbi:MAG TPA: hypothetical protein VHS53_04605, partial [Mucilaginibacter sp.]|nr:hypothetical protein [Mucilaginibacter sp.]
MKKYVLIFLLITAISAGSFSQTKPKPLTNAKVVSLFKAGLSKSVIETTIRNSQANFDVSTDAMIDLKKQGLPDEIIEAMVNKASSGNTSASTTTSLNQSNTASPGSNNLSALDPGVYYYDESSGKQVQLDGSVFSQTKSGSGILTAISYGAAKTKQKAVLSGAQSNFKINSTKPVFYFIFPHNTNGNNVNMLGWYGAASSPNEFLLVKFNIKGKGREVVTGSYGSYSGFSSGIDEANKVAFRYDKLSPGVYKVSLDSMLKDREYAFMFAGTATATATKV